MKDLGFDLRDMQAGLAVHIHLLETGEEISPLFAAEVFRQFYTACEVIEEMRDAMGEMAWRLARLEK